MKTYEVILQIIALVAGILVAVVKKKNEVLVVTFAYNIFSLLSIFIKGDYTTVWSCVVINIRSIVYLFQDRLKKHKYANSIPFVVILAHIVLFILCFNHWYQVLTYVAPIILALALWFESDRRLD